MPVEQKTALEEPQDVQYTAELTRRAMPSIHELYGAHVEQSVVEYAICEALFLASEDIRKGRAIRLESLGGFSRARVGNNIHFTPASALLNPVTGL